MQLWGAFPIDLISPSVSLELCFDGGGGGGGRGLEHQVLMVHHTSPRISRSGSQPTSEKIRSVGRPNFGNIRFVN
jgi:hypothetical protein